MDEKLTLEDIVDVPFEYLVRTYGPAFFLRYKGRRPIRYNWLHIWIFSNYCVISYTAVNLDKMGEVSSVVRGRKDPVIIPPGKWQRFVHLLHWAKGGHNGKT